MTNHEGRSKRSKDGTGRARPQRRARGKGENSPDLAAALTHVIVTVSSPDILSVTVDGEPFPPSDPAGPWTRATMGELLDAVTRNRRIPVRFEVHETDGSTFTDIIPAHPDIPEPLTPRTTPATVNPEPGSAEDGKLAENSRLVEVTADGFVPGEEIAVAVVVAASAAGPDGTGHIRLEPTLLCGAHEMVLIGRISGTAALRRPS